ncbi:uncharacterized protein LOC141649902 [Silene latifolia]|uniref:uncharacterized protein LOC141649902 n=1 Tax=Silene latifolia TaxID=37657 RepID=UPI003D777795
MARGRPPRAGEPSVPTASVDHNSVVVEDVTDEPDETVMPSSGKAPQKGAVSTSGTAATSGTKTIPPVGNAPKTYSQVLKNSSKGMNLSFFPVIDSSVSIEEEDIVKEVEYWQTTLVGTVLGRQSTLVQIESLVSKYWTHITTPKILYFAKGWYYFRFASAEDMEKIRSDTWNVNGFPLVFNPWSPTVVDELNVTHVPVWVLFPNLDPCFWSKSGLSKVASAVGNPICADEHTTNKSKLAFARVLIDVDLSKELPKVRHTKDRCNPAGKPKTAKTVYRPKKTVDAQQVVAPSTASVSNPKTPEKKKSPVKTTVAIKLTNRFSALQDGNLIEPDHTAEPSSEVVVLDTEDEHSVSETEDAVQEAHQLLLDKKVDCGALIETHVKHTALMDISSRFLPYQLVHNNDKHYNGRIWIFWNPVAVALTVLHKSAQHIHCSLLHIASQQQMEVTFVYAFNARLDRRGLWSHLQSISSQVADIDEFSQCIDNCSLVDHPATGCHFTWNNKQGDGLRWAKLDRILVSPQWFASFRSTATFLNAGFSYHSPCLVQIDGMASPCRPKFKYLNCWALSPQFQSTVCRSWSSHYYGGHIISLFQKLKQLRSGLRKLHTSSFTNLSDRVASCKLALKHCQDNLSISPMDSALLREERTLVQEYLQIKRAEMQILFQRAKVQHIQSGDLSTQYVYSKISARKVRNNIGSILDAACKICTGSHEVAQGFLDYYSSLLGSSTPVFPLPSHLFLQDTVSPEQCGSLTQPVRVPEILDALKSIDRNKSPGMDGYSSGFFLDAWTVVGQDFKNAVLEFFQTCSMPKVANSTLLVLVPKMDTPLTVKDYRPIACCTTFYKVISKILANRLKQVLDSIVGPEQAAFVADRDIFDNTMLAHELVSKYGRAYLTPRCLLKVDIRKAFDSVNWTFLKDCLLYLHFPSTFVDWVIACITSPYYSLLINGEVQGFFPGKCGLRQGDPLSPYLFVLCMEVLSRLLRTLPKVKNFSYHPKCVQLNLTHLIFVDDLLVFTRGDLPSVKAVSDCLDQFSLFSGLVANPSKTDLYFGGVAADVKGLILAATGFSEGKFPFRYLGLPLFNARITQDMYQPLLDKLKASIQHWANK